jgi:tetratricopeptide (TPR) repeat protein
MSHTGGGCRSRRPPLALAAVLAVTLVAGCGHDQADRLYLAALDGEETGMTREQQMANLDLAIQLRPDRAYYYETRAGYWISLHEYDRALADLDRDIALTPRPYAYFMRGMALCENGQIARSLADFDTAIAKQPANTQFYRGRGLARAATGDITGAMADVEELVRGEPQRGETWYVRGVVLALMGRDREAVADFDRAAAIRPELVYVVEARLQSLERLGETARAQADREALPQMREERGGCAPCLDPFRY